MSGSRILPFKCSAVISDVDGTLVTDEKILTPENAGCGGGGAHKRHNFFDHQQQTAARVADADNGSRYHARNCRVQWRNVGDI